MSQFMQKHSHKMIYLLVEYLHIETEKPFIVLVTSLTVKIHASKIYSGFK